MKIIKIISTLFSIIGIGLLIASLFIFNHTRNFIKKSSSTTGTVIELLQERSTSSGGSTSYAYYPWIRFETEDGRSIVFKSAVGSNPPSYRVGEEVSVLFDPDNPYNAKINSFFSVWLGFIILSGLGVIFAGIGLGLLSAHLYSKKKIEWLKQNGRKLITDFESVELNTSVKVNGRSPYKIISQWHDPVTHMVHVFESENIWFNPEDFITSESIAVYVDPGNLKRYYMDISFLPESGSPHN